MQVLPHELNGTGNRLLKLLFVIIGFGVICTVMYMDPDTHQSDTSCNASLQLKLENLG